MALAALSIFGAPQLARMLGLRTDALRGALDCDPSRVQGLIDGFAATGGCLSPLALTRLLAIVPRPMSVCQPNPRSAFSGGYAVDLSSGAPCGAGSRLESALRRDPFLRQELEMALGGRILLDSSNDGRVVVQPFAGPCGAPRAQTPEALAAMAMMGAITNVAAGVLVAGDTSTQGAFERAILGALSGLLGCPQPGYQRCAPPPCCVAEGSYALDRNHQTPDQIMCDNSLTVEDKVALLLMMIMKQMDKEIEKQANAINQMQKQANAGKDQKDAPSIDVETMKLKRLIDKRGQMFDMLRQIIDKYNETAKGVIQSMRQ